ncbi:hypothetical protein [Cellulomonas phragmiteti]|uniref:Uncharacterized protein n=1 Tax=Cellulomonas phragmiteti TaxID=478780 RepID=A0ABQ4DLY4_9CELL|nr:hypothetical protein [Cellulomonas phragmiteti]GIG40362.1 hypothetical protein Cph01nite_21240 [Cellulomonas phragmiteti]
MSTVPGPESWRDAGLAPVDPDVPLRLTDVSPDVPGEHDAEEHVPDFPRADRDGLAEEADVVEQSVEVPLDDEDPDA